MRRLLCWITGHRWCVTHYIRFVSLYLHLHPLARQRATCVRCGDAWDDIRIGTPADEIIEVPRG